MPPSPVSVFDQVAMALTSARVITGDDMRYQYFVTHGHSGATLDLLRTARLPLVATDHRGGKTRREKDDFNRWLFICDDLQYRKWFIYNASGA